MCRVNKLSFCEDLGAEYSSSGLSINQRTCKNTLCNECGAPAGRANRVVVTDCGSWYAAAFEVGRNGRLTGDPKVAIPSKAWTSIRQGPADRRPLAEEAGSLAENSLRPKAPARLRVTSGSFSRSFT